MQKKNPRISTACLHEQLAELDAQQVEAMFLALAMMTAQHPDSRPEAIIAAVAAISELKGLEN